MAHSPPPAASSSVSAVNPADERVLFEGSPAAISGLGQLVLVVLTLGIALLPLWLKARGTHYKITTQRIIVDRGLFSKRMDQMDLYRVTDFTVERPFAQRLLGTGNLMIDAMDRTTPRLELTSLKTDVVALYEQLRTAAEAQKHQRNVRLVDYE